MGQMPSRRQSMTKERIDKLIGNYWDFYDHVVDASEWAKLCPIPRACRLGFRIVCDEDLKQESLSLLWNSCINICGCNSISGIFVEIRRIRRDNTSFWSDNNSTDSQATSSNVERLGVPKLLTVRQFYYIYCLLSDIRDCAAHSLSTPMHLGGKKSEKEKAQEQECEICMDRVKEVVLPCTHSFCHRCYKAWFLISKTCPICRTIIKCGEGEELWHLTSNEYSDIRSYAIDLAARLYEFLEKMPVSDKSRIDADEAFARGVASFGDRFMS